jgi:tyrosinase
MNADIQINNSASSTARYVTWTPAPCRVRITNPTGAIGSSINVVLSAVSAATAGAIRFRSSPTGASSTTISLQLPVSGTSVPFFVVGQFGRSSNADGDVRIDAKVGGTVIGQVKLMVRIRKNANLLSPAEISRFVAAFAQLNNQGAGRFADFRNMHNTGGLGEAHGAPGFLPWHRAYLLDLERELQAIDASVALPYWKFDRPAPNVFTPSFLGSSTTNGAVQFGSNNPLQFWVTDSQIGVNRSPHFNVGTEFAHVISEAQTLALGGFGNRYGNFLNMEGDPHGRAHTSFGGSINNPATAPRDPLFFLLHTNVDRLWAKWQRQFGRFDSATAASFFGSPNNRIGHNLPDTMWPWNGNAVSPRPPVAPGGILATSPATTAPGGQPRVRDCLDFQGRLNLASRMGFDYDDVPNP